MSVLAIMSVLTVKDVSAKEYIANDNINISSEYHTVFNNYFSEDKSYTYFSYKCNENDCYFGIDEDGNYLNITYNELFEVNYETGIDEEFSVVGNNIFRHKSSSSSVILYFLIFIFLIYLFYILIGGF